MVDLRATAYIFIYELACAVFLPLPSEAPMFLFPNLSRITILFVCAVGKGTGAFLVFASGSKISKSDLFERILRILRIFAAYTSLTNWSEKIMNSYGFAGFVFLMSVPGMPMRSTIYAVSLMKISRMQFALGAAIGTIVRNSLVYVGYVSIIHFFIK